VLFIMKINKYLSAILTTQLLYDKDVRFPVFDDTGTQIGTEPNIQFKEIFGIGFSYVLGN